MYVMSLYSSNSLRDSLLQATDGQNNKQFTINSTSQKSLNILLFHFKIKFQVKKAKYTTNFKDLVNRFEQNVLLRYHYTEILQHLHFGHLKALNFTISGLIGVKNGLGFQNLRSEPLVAINNVKSQSMIFFVKDQEEIYVHSSRFGSDLAYVPGGRGPFAVY